jgi:hypothetical protein
MVIHYYKATSRYRYAENRRLLRGQLDTCNPEPGTYKWTNSPCATRGPSDRYGLALFERAERTHPNCNRADTGHTMIRLAKNSNIPLKIGSKAS